MTQNYFDDTRPMSDLVEGFHVLGPKTPGARPWDPVKFDEWAEKEHGVMSTGERLAIQFVRDVWTMGKSDVVPHFRLDEAIMGWDERNMLHALAWLNAHVAAPARERLLSDARVLRTNAAQRDLRASAIETLREASRTLRDSNDTEIAKAIEASTKELEARLAAAKPTPGGR